MSFVQSLNWCCYGHKDFSLVIYARRVPRNLLLARHNRENWLHVDCCGGIFCLPGEHIIFDVLGCAVSWIKCKFVIKSLLRCWVCVIWVHQLFRRHKNLCFHGLLAFEYLITGELILINVANAHSKVERALKVTPWLHQIASHCKVVVTNRYIAWVREFNVLVNQKINKFNLCVCYILKSGLVKRILPLWVWATRVTHLDERTFLR